MSLIILIAILGNNMGETIIILSVYAIAATCFIIFKYLVTPKKVVKPCIATSFICQADSDHEALDKFIDNKIPDGAYILIYQNVYRAIWGDSEITGAEIVYYGFKEIGYLDFISSTLSLKGE